VTIAEIPAQQDLSLLFERGVTGRALRLVTEVLETAAKLEIIRITDADAAARQFVGGFVTRLVLDGLLRPTGEHLRKRTTSELQSYVDSFLGRIANRRSSYMSKA
jgi:hypothetical protein